METRAPKVDRISEKTFRLEFADRKIWLVSPVPGGFWVTETFPTRVSFYMESQRPSAFRSEFLQSSQNVSGALLAEADSVSPREGRAQVMSAVQGKVTALYVKLGDEVSLGQQLLTLESMKMEIHIHADQAGVLTEIFVQLGDLVKRKSHVLTITKTD